MTTTGGPGRARHAFYVNRSPVTDFFIFLYMSKKAFCCCWQLGGAGGGSGAGRALPTTIFPSFSLSQFCVPFLTFWAAVVGRGGGSRQSHPVARVEWFCRGAQAGPTFQELGGSIRLTRCPGVRAALVSVAAGRCLSGGTSRRLGSGHHSLLHRTHDGAPESRPRWRFIL